MSKKAESQKLLKSETKEKNVKFPVFYKFDEENNDFPSKTYVLLTSPTLLLSLVNYLGALYALLYVVTLNATGTYMLQYKVKKAVRAVFFSAADDKLGENRKVLLDFFIALYVCWSVNHVLNVFAYHLLRYQQTEENIKMQLNLLDKLEDVVTLQEKKEEIEKQEAELEEKNVQRAKEKQRLFIKRKVVVPVFPVQQYMNTVFTFLFVTIAFCIFVHAQILHGKDPNILKVFSLVASMLYLMVVFLVEKIAGGMNATSSYKNQKDNRFPGIGVLAVLTDLVSGVVALLVVGGVCYVLQ
ncbi:hypothetical protein AGDE_15018 [Angomonas deanei]|nr:hypothetical protein AGDE_15018 [Angomonas deanei]|eukprot:EPY19864.1 hypothetical protein AGDE_15018 [Angomonas deanei]